MGYFFGWLIFSIVVGVIGSSRKIGFFMAFLASIILSPIIGLIITLVSKDKSDEKYKKELIETLKQTNKSNIETQESEEIYFSELSSLKNDLKEHIKKKKFLQSKDSVDILPASEIEEKTKEVSEKIKDIEIQIEQLEKQEKLDKAYDLKIISEEIYKQKTKELRKKYHLDSIDESGVLNSDLIESLKEGELIIQYKDSNKVEIIDKSKHDLNKELHTSSKYSILHENIKQ